MDVKRCDFPGCKETEDVTTFNIQSGMHQRDEFDRVDLCPGHQFYLLKNLLEGISAQADAHDFLRSKGAIK